MVKYTLQDCIDLAKIHNGKYISDQYLGYDKIANWKCDKNHTFENSFHRVKDGSWCRICYLEKIKYNIDEMKNLAISKNGECLSDEYINCKTKLKWKCNKCNNEWLATPHSIKNGTWCPTCGKERADFKKANASRYSKYSVEERNIIKKEIRNRCYNKRKIKRENLIKKYLGDRCIICNSKNKLSCHNIYGNSHKDFTWCNLNDAENLLKSNDFIRLCSKCHVTIHWMMKHFKFNWEEIKNRLHKLETAGASPASATI